MKSVFYIVFATAFTGLVSLTIGKLLLQRLRARLYREEEWFFGFISGAACLSLLVFLLTVAGLAYKGVFLAVGAILIAWGARSGVYRSTAERLPPLPGIWRCLALPPLIWFTLLYVSNALIPEVSPDGTAYHLGFVARYYREHHMAAINDNFFAMLSQGMEMLFLFAFAFGKHSAAATTHFLFLLALPYGIVTYGKRRGQPVAGALAGMLIYLSPVVARDGTVGYIDVGLAAVIFAAFYAIQIWRETRETSHLVIAGICAGFAYACKQTALIALPYVLGVIAFTLWRDRRGLFRAAAVVTALALVSIVPWMARNAFVVNDPVAPLGNAIFPNHYFFLASEENLRQQMSHLNGINSLAEIPIEVTMRGFRAQGIIGPVFLLAPLMLLALRRKIGREVVPAAVVFLLPYPANLGTRFLLPCLPFVATGIASVLADWRGVAILVLYVHALLSMPRMVSLYADQYLWCIRGFEWKAALRKIAEDDFLRFALSDYVIGKQADKIVPAEQSIFAQGSLQMAYHSRHFFITWQSARGMRMTDVLWTPIVDGLQPTWRHEFRFAARPLRHLRIVQTGESKVDEWRVTEIRLFQGERELSRAPEWRLRASHNPWDVQLAFDNSPVTHWRSGSYHQPGMYIEMDLGSDQNVDRVVMDCPHGQGKMAVRLEVLEGGVWKPWGGDPVRSDLPVPERLRRMAAEELKANGIFWLYCDDGEFSAQDYLTRSAQWGWRLVAASNGHKLYHIE